VKDIIEVMATVMILICAAADPAPVAAGDGLQTADIRIRDPFIYADRETGTYYLYAQAGNRAGSGFIGVEAYAGRDLCHWEPPRPVLTLPPDAGIREIWAPEMHCHNGKFYLFVTLTYDRRLPGRRPTADPHWPPLLTRGTHIFRADNPLGPFEPFEPAAQTPAAWMALDGTLFVEDDIPYMVFCHEWVQIIDGTIDCIRLKGDLSGVVGRPRLLFRASAAPGANRSPQVGKVTDGCFLYRSPKSGRLFMLWSTFIPGKDYCVVLTHSESGKLAGPWKEQQLLYARDGGHGMLFESFAGDLLLALHQPNREGKERLHLFRINDNGETLEIEKEVPLP